MKLRKPWRTTCEEHNEYEAHRFDTGERVLGIPQYAECPGGVFLPDDTELQRRIAEVLVTWAPTMNDYAIEKFTGEILDALSVRDADLEGVQE